ncbi:hypothetical protein ABIC83_002985 [Roseateles asaccharophilus]|uniref:hypothetical protein n=1 Tax=Roseateles asaccharophilus TaxID=582607 RepID=UPI0038350434
MKLSALIALSLVAAAPIAHAAHVVDLIAIWKDIASCDSVARGKVVSTKEGKYGGQAGVAVTVKLDKGGKKFTSTVNGAKASDFPKGSAFCAVDYTTD